MFHATLFGIFLAFMWAGTKVGVQPSKLDYPHNIASCVRLSLVSSVMHGFQRFQIRCYRSVGYEKREFFEFQDRIEYL